MSHSYAQNHIHLVFSKNREKLLARNFLPRLWAYTAAIRKNHNLLTFAVGGLGITSNPLFRPLFRSRHRPKLSVPALHHHHPSQSRSQADTKRRAGHQEQHDEDQHHDRDDLGVMQRVIKDQ